MLAGCYSREKNMATFALMYDFFSFLSGYKQLVEIPGCRAEEIRMNACRGYCMTYSFPSNVYTLFLSGGNHVLTSHGSCCTIKTTHDVSKK